MIWVKMKILQNIIFSVFSYHVVLASVPNERFDKQDQTVENGTLVKFEGLRPDTEYKVRKFSNKYQKNFEKISKNFRRNFQKFNENLRWQSRVLVKLLQTQMKVFHICEQKEPIHTTHTHAEHRHRTVRNRNEHNRRLVHHVNLKQLILQDNIQDNNRQLILTLQSLILKQQLSQNVKELIKQI